MVISHGRHSSGWTYKETETTHLKIISFPGETDKSQYPCMAQMLNKEAYLPFNPLALKNDNIQESKAKFLLAFFFFFANLHIFALHCTSRINLELSLSLFMLLSLFLLV